VYSPRRAVWRFSLFLLMTVFLAPVFVLGGVIGSRGPRVLQWVWSWGCCHLCGLRLQVHGRPLVRGPTLFVANHVSYLDIPVIAALMKVRFVAKREVRGWPLFGSLAIGGGTVFVKRSARESIAQIQRLADFLRTGDDLIFFPEGTSSNGLQVLPFKSTLFGAIRHLSSEVALWVQPVSVTYARDLAGRTLEGGREDIYSWHGDMRLMPSLMGALGHEGCEVEVRFHDPVDPRRFADRKSLARYCQEVVAQGVAAALDGGRPLAAPAQA
jgi:lyso-ornithine lipid O-acyltransferase